MKAARTDSSAMIFAEATKKPPQNRKKRPAPLSLRLSDEERRELERAANGQSLNSYVKQQIFGAKARAKQSRRSQPVRDHTALAQALGLLGTMEIAGSLRGLAKATEAGALPVTPETEEELVRACAAVLAIKAELMRALGYDDAEAS